MILTHSSTTVRFLVITDDQRDDSMSVVQADQGDKARFPWVETPNMDWLAREGGGANRGSQSREVSWP